MAKQKADPQVLERVNALVNEHTEDVDRIAQTVEQAERAFLELLEREEGRPLLLSAKEVESWIPFLSQRFAAVDNRHVKFEWKRF